MQNNIRYIKIKQHFEDQKIQKIDNVLENVLKKFNDLEFSGKNIAIAVGSRGINNIALIIKTVVNYFQESGAKPFIFPAMGSHGGATAKGQAKILESYGITENSMNCPIKSSMEVVEIDNTGLENKLYMDKYAYNSDGIFLINRIKPHTSYHANYESGLVKMIVIGVGKHKQALEIHQHGTYGLKVLNPKSANRILSTGKIIGGIAIIENAYDETMIIKALQKDEIMTQEPELLKIAIENMPKLPIKNIDILIVDKIGKNISGVGMDPNIIGRRRVFGEEEPEYPNIKEIIIDDISEESHGNALGIGLADLITEKLYKKINFQAMYENAFTSGFHERAKVPIIAKSINETLKYAFRACGKPNNRELKIIRIKDTLHLGEIYVSETVINDIKIEFDILNETVNLLDKNGNLTSF